jgi:Zn finger protein HypA/HybF involved in hydrogenase expression
MKMTSEQFEEHQENNAGYCKKCDAITSEDVEPDAEGYECPDCGNMTVMGIDSALTLEHIEITEELDEDEEDDDFEFRDLNDLD